MKKVEKHFRLIYIALAISLALFYDLFFWDKEPGLGLLLFVLIYVAGFLLITTLAKKLTNKWALLLLIPVFIMSIDHVLFNNDMARDKVPIFVFLLLFIFSALSTLRNPNKHLFTFRRIPVIWNVSIVFDNLRNVCTDIFVPQKIKNSEFYKKILWGVFISIPFLIAFGVLFMSADAVFAEWMGDFFDFEIKRSTFWRIFRTVMITLLAGSFFYAIISNNKLGEKLDSVLKLDKTTTSVVLGLINGLFALFVFIQIRYLFGDADFVLANGITFANYARSGFFEMVAVMVFAAAILLTIYRSFSHHGYSNLITVLQTILIAQVGVVALSALTRMYVYQEAYGFTVLRLQVEWFIYLILALLIVGAVSLIIRLDFRRYFYAAMAISLIALTVVCSVNIDYVIAKKNIERFLVSGTVTEEKMAKGTITLGKKREPRVDLNYFHSLSVDVLPAFPLLNKAGLSEGQLKIIKSVIARKTTILQKDDSIFEYNLGRERARDAVGME